MLFGFVGCLANNRGNSGWRSDAGGQFQDANVAEVDLGAFGFQTDISFFNGGLTDAVDEFAVDGQFDHAIDTDGGVLIPLVFAETAFFRRFTAFAAGIVRGGLETHSAEYLTVDIGISGLVLIGPVEFEDLNFDPFGQTVVGEGLAFAPDENAGITAGFEVFPFHL